MGTHTGGGGVILKKKIETHKPLNIASAASRCDGRNGSHLEIRKKTCLGPVPSHLGCHGEKWKEPGSLMMLSTSSNESMMNKSILLKTSWLYLR